MYKSANYIVCNNVIILFVIILTQNKNRLKKL